MRWKRPEATLYRRCLVATGVLLLFLLTITVTLWLASTYFLNLRLIKVSGQTGRQVIERLDVFLKDRLIALKQVAHFYAHSETKSDREFRGFCGSLMADVPGFLAVLITDRYGHPNKMAPKDALPLADVYYLTADPNLNHTLETAKKSRSPAITNTVVVGRHGEGFLAAARIDQGQNHLGFALGIFQYQSLLDNLLKPDLLQDFRISIRHGEQPILPALGSAAGTRRRTGLAEPVVEEILIGGRRWEITVEPMLSAKASPANFVSFTILGLGITLSLLISYLFLRWQWRTALLQTEARDSRNRLERAGMNLVEIKAELDLVLNSVDEAIILYNNEKEPVQANAAFLTTFNLTDSGPAMSDAHFHHEHMTQFIGSEAKYWSIFNNLQDSPELTYTDELEAPQPRASKQAPKILSRRAMVVCGAENERRGVLVIYNDVTNIKAMDQAKDEFLSNVTHELRSPLAAIKGFAQTMRKDGQMPAETREEFLSIIYEESTRLQNLIEELLDLRRLEASGEAFHFVPYDLKLLVEDVVRGARTILVSKNISAQVHWSGSHHSRLRGDVAQMSRALRNLLVNAVKYSPEAGRIHVTGHCGSQQIWVEVSDQGAGIGDADLPHVFDKFYRGASRGRQRGTGLGLAIVKHIIEGHGGHLGLRSEVGAGTTFRIELPRNFTPSGAAPDLSAAQPLVRKPAPSRVSG